MIIISYNVDIFINLLIYNQCFIFPYIEICAKHCKCIFFFQKERKGRNEGKRGKGKGKKWKKEKWKNRKGKEERKGRKGRNEGKKRKGRRGRERTRKIKKGRTRGKQIWFPMNVFFFFINPPRGPQEMFKSPHIHTQSFTFQLKSTAYQTSSFTTQIVSQHKSLTNCTHEIVT